MRGLKCCFLLVSVFILTAGMGGPSTPIPTPTPSPQPGPAPAPIKRVVFIGDSHVMGYMGERLHGLMRSAAPGATVETYGLSGSAPGHFASPNASQRTMSIGFSERINETTRTVPYNTPATAPYLGDLLNKPYDLLLLEFGDNIANYRGAFPAASIRAQVEMAMQVIVRSRDYSPTNCFWITPTFGQTKAPYQKTTVRLKELIQEIEASIAGRCQLVDGTKLPAIRDGEVQTVDGLHLTRDWAYNWATAIFTKLGI